MIERPIVSVGLRTIACTTRAAQSAAVRELLASLVAAGGNASASSTSVSHSVDRVAAAVCSAGRCGVDVEPIDRPVRIEKFADRLLSADERHLAQHPASRMRLIEAWVVREAAWKACRLGFAAIGLPTSVCAVDEQRWLVSIEGHTPLEVVLLRQGGAALGVAAEPGFVFRLDVA